MANIYDVNAGLQPSNFVGNFQQGLQFGQQQRELREKRQREQTVRGLAPQILAGDPAAYNQAAAADPKMAGDYMGARDGQLKKLTGMVSFIDNAYAQAKTSGSNQALEAALRLVDPYVYQLTGHHAELTPDFEQEWPLFKAQVEGAQADTTRQGLAPRVVGNSLVDHTGKVLYQAPQEQEYQWSDRAGAWIPKPMAGAAQPQPGGFSSGTGGSRFNVNIEGIDPAIQKRLADTAAFMKQAGYDDAAITSFIEAQLPKNADQAYEQAPPELRVIRVDGIGPKTEEITPYQQAQLDLSRDRLSAANAARDQATQARQVAADAKALAAQQKEEARQVAAAESAYGLISAIDSLTNHPGFGALGTALGDAQISTPLIRSDAKDADAKLRNISGQVALATMNQLKALSSQGATGFGALSAPELSLLQNSIATLQRENISNAELKRSLATIRQKMEKISSWKATQQQPANAPTQPGRALRYNPATGDFD